MKHLFLSVAFLSVAWTAHAEPPAPQAAPRCENAALMNGLRDLEGGTQITVFDTDAQVRLEAASGTILSVSCDQIDAPIADAIDTPERGATTRIFDALVVSKTQAAISIEIPAELADPQPISITLLDDQSIHIAKAGQVHYAFAQHFNGSVVEIESASFGCACERLIDPSGRLILSPLQIKAPSHR